MVIGLSQGPVVAAIGGGLSGSGAGWLFPHLSRMILSRSPPSARGRAVGFFFSAIYLGDLLNPLIIRPISLELGLRRTFLIVGGIIAPSALQIVLPRRKKRPPSGTRPFPGTTQTEYKRGVARCHADSRLYSASEHIKRMPDKFNTFFSFSFAETEAGFISGEDLRHSRYIDTPS